MGQLIYLETLKKNTNDKICVDVELENELVGLAKHLFFSQIIDEYGKAELIGLLYRYLNFENRCFLEAFIEENPGLKVKYNFIPQVLKKSAN